MPNFLSNRTSEAEVADATLVAEAQAGDRRAFSALVSRHQALVFRVCYRILGNDDDAADAMQEAFIRAYRRLDSFRGQSAFKTWLMRLTVNVSLNERERQKPTVPIDEFHLATVNDPLTELERAEVMMQIHQSLQQLPANHRAAVVLRDLEGFSYAETAAALGVPEGTAKGWVHRGRVGLKDLLT